jgi:2-phospho-L-lactate/phosphoenolpyruvate guanylyltransferase
VIWRVVIPFKGGADRKSRLAGHLTASEREELSRKMLFHVAQTIAAVPDTQVSLLAPAPIDEWPHDWILDAGDGLNAALQKARCDAGSQPFAIIHADLPILALTDVAALLAGAEEHGCAIAPDRHGSGTNALAIADSRPFRFAFGADSFPYHLREAGSDVAILRRHGLALDVDTPQDLAMATEGILGTAVTKL